MLCARFVSMSRLLQIYIYCAEHGKQNVSIILVNAWTSLIYIIKGDMFVCLSVCLFSMASQTAGPIKTKLDIRTHVHPGSVSGKVNVKVIHVWLRG